MASRSKRLASKQTKLLVGQPEGSDKQEKNSRPNSSWEQHQAYKRQHENGKAKWRGDWEVVYYQEGDQRLGKPMLEGKSFFRHIICGGEYSCTNMPRTVKEHDCSKVSSRHCTSALTLACGKYLYLYINAYSCCR